MAGSGYPAELLEAEASPDGFSPDFVNECERPVACVLSRWMKVPAVASSFVAASLNGPVVSPMT